MAGRCSPTRRPSSCASVVRARHEGLFGGATVSGPDAISGAFRKPSRPTAQANPRHFQGSRARPDIGRPRCCVARPEKTGINSGLLQMSWRAANRNPRETGPATGAPDAVSPDPKKRESIRGFSRCCVGQRTATARGARQSRRKPAGRRLSGAAQHVGFEGVAMPPVWHTVRLRTRTGPEPPGTTAPLSRRAERGPLGRPENPERGA
jgi:hypothetical protein